MNTYETHMSLILSQFLIGEKGVSESHDQLCALHLFRVCVQDGTFEFSTEALATPRSAASSTFQEPGEPRTSTLEPLGSNDLCSPGAT